MSRARNTSPAGKVRDWAHRSKFLFFHWSQCEQVSIIRHIAQTVERYLRYHRDTTLGTCAWVHILFLTLRQLARARTPSRSLRSRVDLSPFWSQWFRAAKWSLEHLRRMNVPRSIFLRLPLRVECCWRSGFRGQNWIGCLRSF